MAPCPAQGSRTLHPSKAAQSPPPLSAVRRDERGYVGGAWGWGAPDTDTQAGAWQGGFTPGQAGARHGVASRTFSAAGQDPPHRPGPSLLTHHPHCWAPPAWAEGPCPARLCPGAMGGFGTAIVGTGLGPGASLQHHPAPVGAGPEAGWGACPVGDPAPARAPPRKGTGHTAPPPCRAQLPSLPAWGATPHGPPHPGWGLPLGKSPSPCLGPGTVASARHRVALREGRAALGGEQSPGAVGGTSPGSPGAGLGVPGCSRRGWGGGRSHHEAVCGLGDALGALDHGWALLAPQQLVVLKEALVAGDPMGAVGERQEPWGGKGGRHGAGRAHEGGTWGQGRACTRGGMGHAAGAGQGSWREVGAPQQGWGSGPGVGGARSGDQGGRGWGQGQMVGPGVKGRGRDQGRAAEAGGCGGRCVGAGWALAGRGALGWAGGPGTHRSPRRGRP